MRRRVLLGLAAALLAGGAAAAILALRESRSSSGPLACPPGCAHLTLAFPVDPRRPFTYGLLLLRNRGGEAAVLERVGARELSPVASVQENMQNFFHDPSHSQHPWSSIHA